MLSLFLLPPALLSLCAEGFPISHFKPRAVNQVYSGSTTGTTVLSTTTSLNNSGTDAYNFYSGDGSLTAGWPDISQWASFDYLWNANLPLINNSCVNIGAPGPNNSPAETVIVGQMIQTVATTTNIDPRFILAIMMQESKGCVRVQTTYGGNANPGLMQSHAGPNSCSTVGTDPCPATTIQGMLQDGAGGTDSGDGLAAIMNQLAMGVARNQNSRRAFGNDTSDSQLYYRTARMYNSGSIVENGDLGQGVATHCYSSDIANRLLGWTFATSLCPLDGGAGAAAAATYTATPTATSMPTVAVVPTPTITAPVPNLPWTGNSTVSNATLPSADTNTTAINSTVTAGSAIFGAPQLFNNTTPNITAPLDPNSNVTAIIANIVPTNVTDPAPAPAAPTTDPSLNNTGAFPGPWSCVVPEEGDDCDCVAERLGVTRRRFHAANPHVGEDCGGFRPEWRYCA